MRSKGSRFTLGVWGLRVCSLDVAQPFATVRNRSQPSAWWPYGRAYGKFCRRGRFLEVSYVVVASFRVAGVALRDIQTCFVTCRKSFCVAGAIPLRRFQKMRCIFSRQAQHFGRVHRHFAWQAQHFRRVVLRVFANRIGRAASSGDKVQIPWQAWHFVRCAENWRKPRTKHRFWDSKISGSWENS